MEHISTVLKKYLEQLAAKQRAKMEASDDRQERHYAMGRVHSYEELILIANTWSRDGEEEAMSAMQSETTNSESEAEKQTESRPALPVESNESDKTRRGMRRFARPV